MKCPESMLEWLSCGVGGLLLLVGILLAVCSCYVLIVNILHQWIRKDGKYTSLIPLIPAVCICIGDAVISPVESFVVVVPVGCQLTEPPPPASVYGMARHLLLRKIDLTCFAFDAVGE